VMAALTLLDTAEVGTVKEPPVEAGAIMTLAGTETEVLPLESATAAPPAGAAPAKVSVHVLDPVEGTMAGAHTREESASGWMVTPVVAEAPP